MATFGNTTTTTDWSRDIEAHHGYIIAHCPETGTADSIIARCYASTNNHKARCALYKADESFFAETVEITLVAGVGGAKTFAFAEPKPSLEHADYRLVCIAEAGAGEAYFSSQYTVGFNQYGDNNDAAYPTWNNPLATSHTYTDHQGNIYCSYTAGAPAGQPYRKRVQGIVGMRTW